MIRARRKAKSRANSSSHSLESISTLNPTSRGLTKAAALRFLSIQLRFPSISSSPMALANQTEVVVVISSMLSSSSNLITIRCSTTSTTKISWCSSSNNSSSSTSWLNSSISSSSQDSNSCQEWCHRTHLQGSSNNSGSSRRNQRLSKWCSINKFRIHKWHPNNNSNNLLLLNERDFN